MFLFSSNGNVHEWSFLMHNGIVPLRISAGILVSIMCPSPRIIALLLPYHSYGCAEE